MLPSKNSLTSSFSQSQSLNNAPTRERESEVFNVNKRRQCTVSMECLNQTKMFECGFRGDVLWFTLQLI